jgi:hypothetical protein
MLMICQDHFIVQNAVRLSIIVLWKGYAFNDKNLFEHHVARAHEMRNCEKCPDCGKQFSRLKAHLLICSAKWSHTERRKFECLDCNKIYLDKGSLNKHIKDCCKTTD